MAILDRDTVINYSKIKIALELAELSCKVSFNPNGNYDECWTNLFSRYLATTMIEGTDGQTLSAKDRQCIINKLSQGLPRTSPSVVIEECSYPAINLFPNNNLYPCYLGDAFPNNNLYPDNNLYPQ